jgi:hypothetical protein
LQAVAAEAAARLFEADFGITAGSTVKDFLFACLDAGIAARAGLDEFWLG